MVTLVFPGQGSQYVGMGKNLDSDLFHQANEILNYDLKKLCFDGPMDELTLTQNTQPAILTHSIALLNQLKDEFPDLKIDTVLGHSVGEYGALVAADVLSFEDALNAVHLRGQYMQSATPVGVGAMYAILKVPAEIVDSACDVVSSANDNVMIANYNEPNQTVISGHKDACERAVTWLKANYLKSFRAIPLKVSAPFHSSLMKPAEEKLAPYFNSLRFNSNSVDVITNIDAMKNPVGTLGEVFQKKLTEQVCGSVLWKQSIAKLKSEAIVLEVGPGKVLNGLIKKINPDLKVISLDQENWVQEIKEIL